MAGRAYERDGWIPVDNKHHGAPASLPVDGARLHSSCPREAPRSCVGVHSGNCKAAILIGDKKPLVVDFKELDFKTRAASLIWMLKQARDILALAVTMPLSTDPWTVRVVSEGMKGMLKFSSLFGTIGPHAAVKKFCVAQNTMRADPIPRCSCKAT